jgi:hypothetical protein
MSPTDHRHTPAEERAIREAALDETIAETFPASDPPSTIPNPDDHDALKREEGTHPAAADRADERRSDPTATPKPKLPADATD